MKRQAFALVVVVAMLASTGCTGLVFGDGMSLEAEPAAVSDEALSGTEFQLGDTQTVRINETVSVAGQERTIRATNHVAIYNRTVDIGPLSGQVGAFVLASTPDYTVAGRSLNPVAGMSNRELVERFRGQLEGQLGGLENLRAVDNRTEPVLGGAAEVTTFAAETQYQGRTVTVNIHVTKVRHEDDVIVAIGVHPEALQQQAPEVFTLMRGIEHPAEG